MRPYTRKLMEEAHTLGRPVMRTMFYEFPEQECCWELKEQYMFGSDMLAAPILYEGRYNEGYICPQAIPGHISMTVRPMKADRRFSYRLPWK